MKIGNYTFGTRRAGARRSRLNKGDPLLGSLIKFEKRELEEEDEDEDHGRRVEIRTNETMTTTDSSNPSSHPAFRRHQDSVRRHRGKGTFPPLPPTEAPEHTFKLGDRVQVVSGADKGKTGHVAMSSPKILEVILDHRKESKYFFPRFVRGISALPPEPRVSGMTIEIPADWDPDLPFEPKRFIPVGRDSKASSKQLVAGDCVNVIGGTHRGKRGKVMYVTSDRVQLYLEDSEEVQNINKANVQHRLSKPIPVRFSATKDPILASRSGSTLALSTSSDSDPILAKRSTSSFASAYTSLVTGPLPKPVKFEPRHGFRCGDKVDIVEGIYKNKVGRVLKVTTELVQLTVGGSNYPCYLSPLMIRARYEEILG